MSRKLDSYSPSPAIQQIANTFRLTGWISFWTQLVLAVISAVVLLVANFSRGAGDTSAANRVGTGFGVFFAISGLVALLVSIYWAFRYTRVGLQLKTPNTDLRPSKADTIQLIQLGIIVNLVGMLLTIVGAEAIIGGLIARSLAQPQAYPFAANNVTPLIRPLDFFVVQANTNTIAAHFAAIVGSLWLLRRMNR